MRKPEPDFFRGLKWLMFFRVTFTTFLLGSTIMLQFRESSLLSVPIALFYVLIVSVFFLSFIYALLINRIKHCYRFAFFQFGIDTFVVTIIIFVTGSFSSIFSFLYLLVIIYSSVLLFRKGSLVIALLCSVQYAAMVCLEYFAIFRPLGIQNGQLAFQYDWSFVFYKVIITIVACFAVAFLTGLLSEREQRARKELRAMEDHIKRVEKLAGIGKMAAGLAHEIKNPLASLSGSVQILKEEIQYDPVHDKLMQIVLREADRLSSLVGDFLMFARPPAGIAQPVELEPVLKETVSLFERGKICRDRISIIKDYVSGVKKNVSRVWVKMDPAHLKQVLWNLLLNAAEAIEGQGKIHVRIAPSNGEYAVIEIEDTGCGMTPEQIRSVFDPFYTTKPNGTGLGLSIVHSVLKSYDSRLDVESQIQAGSRMTLSLKKIDPPT
ncbi:MAG: ATP-binding protein [Desulfobacterales bacterium]